MPLKGLFKRSSKTPIQQTDTATLENDPLLGLKLPNLEFARNECTELTAMIKEALEGNTTLSISQDLIGQDDVCNLGRWLYAEGGLTYASHSAFVEVRSAHKDFHYYAALLVAMINANTMESRSEAFGEITAGNYAQSVRKLNSALDKLEALA